MWFWLVVNASLENNVTAIKNLYKKPPPVQERTNWDNFRIHTAEANLIYRHLIQRRLSCV